jgi:dihydroorotase
VAADVAVLDPALEWTYDPASGFSKSQNSPWKSKRLVGRCTQAFVGGKLVHGEK